MQDVQANGCGSVRINDEEKITVDPFIQMMILALCRFPTWTLRTGDSSRKE